MSRVCSVQSPFISRFLALGEMKTSMGFGEVVLRGIPANFCVCMAVFLYIASEDIISKILSVYLPVLTFIASGYEHSVANMFFFSISAFEGTSASYGTFVWKNLIPSTIGNLIGGGIFVGGLCYYLYAFGEAEHLKAKTPTVKIDWKKWSCISAWKKWQSH